MRMRCMAICYFNAFYGPKLLTDLFAKVVGLFKSNDKPRGNEISRGDCNDG